MTKFRKSLIAGVVALGLGAGSFAAYADKPDCGPGRAGHASWGEHRKENMEKRAAELHDKLKLNASQETAWKAYVARMQPEERPQRPDRAEFDRLTAPERMEKLLGFMQQRQQKLADRVEATKSFYAVLTPEQKKVFDESFHRGPREHGPRHGEKG